MWALNKNPADRPTDADQFIAALEAAKAAILSGGAGQRTASIAALIAAVGGAGGGSRAGAADGPSAGRCRPTAYAAPGYDGRATRRADRRPRPTDERRRNWWPWLSALLVALLIAGGGVAAYLLTRPHKRVVPTVTGESSTRRGPSSRTPVHASSVLNVPEQPDRGHRDRPEPARATQGRQAARP